MTAHKWADEIKAWADGKEIEQRHPRSVYKDYSVWHAFDGQWGKHQGWECRIKPETIHKPDVVVNTPLSLFDAESGRAFTATNVQLLFDGETRHLKSVRMIGKPDPAQMEALLRKMAEEDLGFDTLTEIKEAMRTD